MDSTVITLYEIKPDATVKKIYFDPNRDASLLKKGTVRTIFNGEFCAELELNKVYVLNLYRGDFTHSDLF